MRGETLIFVCSYGCVVGPAGGPMRKLAGMDDGVNASAPSIQLIKTGF